MENSISNFWGYSHHWRLLFLLGILTIFCGIWFFAQPMVAYVLIATFFGLSMLIGGVVQLLTSSLNRDAPGWGWLIVIGICDVIIGFILVVNIGFTEEALPYVFSFIVFFKGILSLITSSRMYKKFKTWWIYLLNGILLLILSALFFFSPFSTVFTIVFIASLMMIYWGISLIFLSLDFRPKKIDKK